MAVDSDLSSINAAGNSAISNTASSGQSAINSFNPEQAGALNNQQQQSLYGPGGSQSKQMGDYYNQYLNTINNNPSVTSLYNTANQQFNVQPLQQQANQLNNAVLQAPITNLNKSRGFNVDQNQLNSENNLAQMMLAPSAQAATSNANTAAQNAGNYVNAGIQQNQFSLLPVQAYGAFLGQQLGEQATGLDQNQTNTLNALVSKMQTGAQLSAAEMQAFESLAAQEESAQAGIEQQQIANQGQLANTIQGQKYVSIPAGQQLINTFAQGILNPSTGKVRSY